MVTQKFIRTCEVISVFDLIKTFFIEQLEFSNLFQKRPDFNAYKLTFLKYSFAIEHSNIVVNTFYSSMGNTKYLQVYRENKIYSYFLWHP